MSSTPKLQRRMGWFLLGALGIGCVIAGEFAGWNWGIARGGWGGMVVATLLVAVMYFALVFSIAEMAAIIPTAGAGYAFARSAFGPLAGFLTGIAVALEYVAAVGVIALFIESYFYALTGLAGWYVPAVCFTVACGLHCLGVGAAMRVMVVFAGAALLGILLFVAVAIPHARIERLFDIAPLSTSVHTSSWLPLGPLGLWACIPFALAGFMGVEGIPLAAEEAHEPAKSVPRGLLFALSILLLSMLALLAVAPAVQGSRALGQSASPLVDALAGIGKSGLMRIVATIVNIAGLMGLAASFFSAMYAYSRQIFALSRAGYLPATLALTNRRHTPWVAVVVPALIAYLLALSGAGDQLYVLIVFAALVSYLLMFSSHIALRLSQPHLPRPYRTPGGITTAVVGSLLAVISFIACFLAAPQWSFAGVGFMALSIAYFYLYARHRVQRHAPEEEFALAASSD